MAIFFHSGGYLANVDNQLAHNIGALPVKVGWSNFWVGRMDMDGGEKTLWSSWKYGINITYVARIVGRRNGSEVSQSQEDNYRLGWIYILSLQYRVVKKKFHLAFSALSRLPTK